ncbi:hypothetical protein SLEP1_g58289 [Rubroshorea leprosula]|uniref:Uncharacterized protein n=1 Tax=Rubroshorea leprosula TaxID=152421 RepID=A0AAV5MSG5_9ROSI|nr:hypothetical protein SLEP1_g58289 [Rubroshorea leprosula]
MDRIASTINNPSRLSSSSPIYNFTPWQISQGTTCLLVQNPPDVQQLHPLPHLRDFLVPTAPSCLTPLKRSAGIRTLTNTSEQLSEPLRPLISSNTKQLCSLTPLKRSAGTRTLTNTSEQLSETLRPPTSSNTIHLLCFPADQHQQHNSSIPFPHSPAVSTTTTNALSPTTDMDGFFCPY